MQSLKHAFRFIGASLRLAFKHSQLRKSWYYLGIGSLLLIILWFIPLALVVLLIGLTPLGLALIGALSVFLIFSLLIWGEITTLQLSPPAAILLQESSLELSLPLKPIQTHWGDIALWMLSKPGFILLTAFRRLLRHEAQTTSLYETRGLVPPVISLEDRKLAGAVERIEQILNDNLLRFRPALVQVHLIARIVQWMMLGGGMALGTFVAVSLANPTSTSPWQQILGMGVGLLPAWLLTLIGVLFSTFTRTCYQTSLYIWVRNVELARKKNDPDKAAPPEILRNVLGAEQ